MTFFYEELNDRVKNIIIIIEVSELLINIIDTTIKIDN